MSSAGYGNGRMPPLPSPREDYPSKQFAKVRKKNVSLQILKQKKMVSQSEVISTHNEQRIIEPCLSQLQGIDDETVVVDSYKIHHPMRTQQTETI